MFSALAVIVTRQVAVRLLLPLLVTAALSHLIYLVTRINLRRLLLHYLASLSYAKSVAYSLSVIIGE